MEVRPVRPDEQRDAVACLLEASLGRDPETAEIEAFVGRARSMGQELSRQVVAVTPEGEIAGVALYDASPDGSVTASPPTCRASFDKDSLKREILHALRRECASQGLAVLMIFCDERDEALFALLSTCGFERLATLQFMERAITSGDRLIEPDPHIAWTLFTEATEETFVRTVEKTYEETLDCPKLNEGRRVRERLAGYRRAPGFSPELWMIGKVEEEPAVCLLLLRHPEDASCELSYVGVVPSHRGKGLGYKTMEKALQSLALRDDVERLWLAVDGANAPAVRVYERLGFAEYDRRAVYFSLLARPPRDVPQVSEKS